MKFTPAEAYDLLAHSELVLERLAAATPIAQRPGMEPEQRWLAEATRGVEVAREGIAAVMERAVRLPELESLREEQAALQQEAWVDVVERLLAGITFHAGSRAPVIEALIPPKVKLPALRRARREIAEKFAVDLERRLAGSYVTRIFSGPGFEFAQAVVAQIKEARERWLACFSAEPLGDEEARALRLELTAAARRLDVPMRQARLLAEAALVPVVGAFEESGLGAKPRRRAARATTPEGELPCNDGLEFAPPEGTAPEPVDEPAAVDAEIAPELEVEYEPDAHAEVEEPARPKGRKRAAAAAPAVTARELFNAGKKGAEEGPRRPRGAKGARSEGAVAGENATAAGVEGANHEAGRAGAAGPGLEVGSTSEAAGPGLEPSSASEGTGPGHEPSSTSEAAGPGLEPSSASEAAGPGLEPSSTSEAAPKAKRPRKKRAAAAEAVDGAGPTDTQSAAAELLASTEARLPSEPAPAEPAASGEEPPSSDEGGSAPAVSPS